MRVTGSFVKKLHTAEGAVKEQLVLTRTFQYNHHNGFVVMQLQLPLQTSLPNLLKLGRSVGGKQGGFLSPTRAHINGLKCPLRLYPVNGK